MNVPSALNISSAPVDAEAAVYWVYEGGFFVFFGVAEADAVGCAVGPVGFHTGGGGLV